MEKLQMEYGKVVIHLQYKNEELLKDNLVLVDEVSRLRSIVAFYQERDAKAMKQQQMHMITNDTVKKESQNILERLEKVESTSTKNLQKKLKQLKKELISKKVQSFQKKYDEKRQECQKLKQFRDKLVRLYNTYQNNSGKKDNEEIYKWIYNQVVRSKSSTTKALTKVNNGAKNTTKPSRFKPNNKENQSTA